MDLRKPLATLILSHFDAYLERLSLILKRFSILACILKYVIAVLLILFVVLVLTIRYWFLPNVQHYRLDVEKALSQSIGLKVKIGGVSGDWVGINPRLIVSDISVFDNTGRPALFLGKVENIVSWTSILYADLRLRSLEIDEPILSIRRDKGGTIYIAGMPFTQENSGDSTLADWVLRQERIVIRDAFISWDDEKLGVKPLTLSKVFFLLENRGDHHRFGLQAIPPKELASPLDLRGDIEGESLAEWKKWQGVLYAQFNYTDIAAWRTWVSFPIAIRQGIGGLKLWLTFDQGRPIKVTADVELKDVRTRLDKSLPELDLSVMSGRVTWKKTPTNFEFSTQHLGFVTKNGIVLQPTDFYFRFVEGTKNRLPKGELKASVIELEPLRLLAYHLPINEEWRKQLTSYAPKGAIYDLAVRWRGEINNPINYSIRSYFRNLGISAANNFPGLSGISGSIDANQKAGIVLFNSLATKIAFTKVFRESLNLDRLTGQVKWSVQSNQLNLRLNNISFSNTHLAGNAFGEYRTAKDGPGWIDLHANLIRGDARYVARYMPLSVGQATHDWLAKSLIAGKSSDVRLRLKGNLLDFPFDKKPDGIFQVTVKAEDAVLNYADGWPKIENIQGDLIFRGNRMEIYSPQASIYGTQLSKVQVVIPDLSKDDQILEIQGQAEGPSQEFVKFINHSPVSRMIHGFTGDIKIQGAGKLALKIDLPLSHTENAKIAGNYHFDKNQVVMHANMPPIENVDGTFDFTDSSIKAKDIHAQIFGGSAVINVVTKAAHNIEIDLAGNADFVNLRKGYSHPALSYLEGAPSWKAKINIRNQKSDFLFESNLVGLKSDLPAPFAKAANQEMSLRLEKKITGEQQDNIFFNYGKLISAHVMRRNESGEMIIDRGIVNVGNATPVSPFRSGLWIRATLSYLNLDEWLSIVSIPSASAAGGRGGFDIRLDNLEFFGKRFNSLRVAGVTYPAGWQANLTGKELNGDVQWRSIGRGQVIGRFKNFTLPETITQVVANDKTSESLKSSERAWPSIDFAVENFYIKDRALGKVELLAATQGADWRIDKIKLTIPEGALQVDGVWSNWLTQPQTKLNVALEVKDIGQALTRFGYADGVKRGAGKIEGQLAWVGNPLSFDYPSLNGKLTVEAYKGQFSKIEPGIGKLLGVLSLQSLPRRITLDFRDVFSEGFAFDLIGGEVRIISGVMYTDTLLIDGPAARVVMGGEVNLAAETQKIRVKVSPKLGDSVALASALLANPVVGVVAFLMQKILKDPLDKLIFYEYDVTGTWSEPQVAKVQIPPQVPGEKTF